MKLLEEDEDLANDAVNALINATAEFDGVWASHGATLLPDLLKQLYEQGWPP